MTGKEFKEYINKTLEDDNIIYYIVIGRKCDPELFNLEFVYLISNKIKPVMDYVKELNKDNDW